jgi:hypothetical protein
MALSLAQIKDRIIHFRQVWETLASETRFGDLDLETFIAGTEDSLTTREQIRELETLLDGLRTQRDQADRQSALLMERFVFLVRGTPAHGDDSPFYRALGYIPASERKTGLTRKFRQTPDD